VNNGLKTLNVTAVYPNISLSFAHAKHAWALTLNRTAGADRVKVVAFDDTSTDCQSSVCALCEVVDLGPDDKQNATNLTATVATFSRDAFVDLAADGPSQMFRICYKSHARPWWVQVGTLSLLPAPQRAPTAFTVTNAAAGAIVGITMTGGKKLRRKATGGDWVKFVLISSPCSVISTLAVQHLGPSDSSDATEAYTEIVINDEGVYHICYKPDSHSEYTTIPGDFVVAAVPGIVRFDPLHGAVETTRKYISLEFNMPIQIQRGGVISLNTGRQHHTDIALPDSQVKVVNENTLQIYPKGGGLTTFEDDYEVIISGNAITARATGQAWNGIPAGTYSFSMMAKLYFLLVLRGHKDTFQSSKELFQSSLAAILNISSSLVGFIRLEAVTLPGAAARRIIPTSATWMRRSGGAWDAMQLLGKISFNHLVGNQPSWSTLNQTIFSLPNTTVGPFHCVAVNTHHIKEKIIPPLPPPASLTFSPAATAAVVTMVAGAAAAAAGGSAVGGAVSAAASSSGGSGGTLSNVARQSALNQNGPASGNLMGMVGHVQFLNYAAAVSGVPNDTVALGDGVGWANLAFDPPWYSENPPGSNTTNASATRRALIRWAQRRTRRLLDDDESLLASSADGSDDDVGCTGPMKECAYVRLQGTLFYFFLIIIAVAVLHYSLQQGIMSQTGMAPEELPGEVQFPGAEINSFIGAWSGLSLSLTTVFSHYVAEFTGSSHDSFIISVAVFLVLILQLPYLIWHTWWLQQHLVNHYQLSASFRTISWFKILALRPSCNVYEAWELGHTGQFVCNWIDFTLCLPFRLGYQGVWVDAPDPAVPQFTAVYGPLFTLFSPLGSFSHLYGMFRMLHTLLVIWIIGSTVEATAAGIDSPPSNNSSQLFALAGVHWAQAAFLITQWPFNERVENVIQMFISGCQGLFFFTVADTAAGNKVDADQLNNINMVAMTVLAAASAKGSAKFVRKNLIQTKRALRTAISESVPFCTDPCGYVTTLLDTVESDAMPLLDTVPFNIDYICTCSTVKHMPLIFQHSNQTQTAQLVRRVADEWRLEQGWINPVHPLLENSKGPLLGVGKDGRGWQSHSFTVFAPDIRSKRMADLEARIHAALKAHHCSIHEDEGILGFMPAMEFQFDALAHHAAALYSVDYVFACRTLELVALEETRQKMAVLSTLAEEGAFGDLLSDHGQAVYSNVELVLVARLRSVKDRLSCTLAECAKREGSLKHWPAGNRTDHHTWAASLHNLHAEITEDSHIGEWTRFSRRINTTAKAEAVLFVAEESDTERMEMKETAVDHGESDEDSCTLSTCTRRQGAARPAQDDVDDDVHKIKAEDYLAGKVMFGSPTRKVDAADEKDTNVADDEEYETWRIEHKETLEGLKRKQIQDDVDKEKRHMATHLPPLVGKKLNEMGEPLEIILVEHDDLITRAIHEYCLAAFEIVCQMVAEGYQRFPPIADVPSLTMNASVEANVTRKIAELLLKYELAVASPQVTEKVCQVAQICYEVRTLQLRTARQFHWQSVYMGRLEPWQNDGEWAPKLLKHAIATLKKAHGVMPAVFEANEQLARQLQSVYSLLEEMISTGFHNVQEEIDRVSYLLDRSITIGLGAMDKAEPKKRFMAEFAPWLVAQSQKDLKPGIYCRGSLSDLPEDVFYSVIWAVREAQLSLFYGDKYVSANEIIESLVTPLVEDYVEMFHEKMTAYVPHTQMDFAYEVFAHAEHLLSRDEELSTTRFENRISATLERAVKDVHERAQAEMRLQRLSCVDGDVPDVPMPDVASLKVLASFVAHTTSTAIVLHLSNKQIWADESSPPMSPASMLPPMSWIVENLREQLPNPISWISKHMGDAPESSGDLESEVDQPRAPSCGPSGDWPGHTLGELEAPSTDPGAEGSTSLGAAYFCATMPQLRVSYPSEEVLLEVGEGLASQPPQTTWTERDHFTCPITQELMQDPVMCSDGHSYERCAIEEWINNQRRYGLVASPRTGAPLESYQVIPNHQLRNAIQLGLQDSPSRPPWHTCCSQQGLHLNDCSPTSASAASNDPSEEKGHDGKLEDEAKETADQDWHNPAVMFNKHGARLPLKADVGAQVHWSTFISDNALGTELSSLDDLDALLDEADE